ncbi:MAG: hypothetical protein KJO13_07140, partial [Gammaproteobacteria bacterium]|nr:hypothetical protein [Gammaproteobacteria bacterium]
MTLSKRLTIVSLLWAGISFAQKPASIPRPCLGEPELADFDFWLGRWDVHMEDGRKAGVNSITKEQGGCVLVERWTSVRGGSGISLNYFDAATAQWVQNWVGADGSVIDIRGGLQADGSMLLAGTLRYATQTDSTAFRGRWTPLDDGRVRQYFEESKDDGKTWSAWFTGYYSPRVESAR